MILTDWRYAAIAIFVVMAMPGPAMLLGLAVATQHGVRRSLYVGGGILAAFSVFAVIREYVRHSSATRWLHLLSGTVYFAAAGMLGLRR
ncbi:MAG: hypothetical protein J0J01_06695 [Reyranella sp.]|uniref:hypothetical protein n=1 Tax=Reyranella sp. TaxID=1929291 RepID=UPI001AD05C35|nr:hypothetical protein [Reyranella sp.]MBN9086578.1 hypothetical protein [Reyranella sp.]